jgi:hypothetical protein
MKLCAILKVGKNAASVSYLTLGFVILSYFAAVRIDFREAVMAHIDRIADKAWFLASFFSGAAKDGLFDVALVSLGGLAISVFLIAAHYMPVGMQLAAAP